MNSNIDEIDFTRDTYADIVKKDPRFNGKAYALLMDVFDYLINDRKGNVTGQEILDEFKERALDQYGPLAYTVLTDWGVNSTEDIGAMMFNLADSHRICRGENDFASDFENGYDFKETFLGPFQA